MRQDLHGRNHARGSEDHSHRLVTAFGVDAGAESYDYRIAVGGWHSDRFFGDEARDYFWGLIGNDKLIGGGEDDALYGDQGNDLLVGGAGADRLDGGGGRDRLFGGNDADALMGGAGKDYLDEGAGHGMLEGGAGNDVLVGGQGPDAFVVDPHSGDDVILDFTAGPGMFDHLALRDLRWEDLSFEDTARGVVIRWDGGSVLLKGVMQQDLAQDDFMFADAPDLPPALRPPAGPAPEQDASAGRPGMSGSGHWAKASPSDVPDTSLGFTGEVAYRLVVGTSGDDAGQGGDAWDHFIGRDGNDTFAGAGGNDLLQGDAGDDHLDGGPGMDKLDGGMGGDVLIGGEQADELMGRAGDDRLDEGPGHGMIEGGEGNDFIIGGTGADAFIVDPMSGDDIVFDFEATGLAQGAFDHIAFRDISPGQVTVSDGITREWEGVAYQGVLVSWNTDADPDAEGSVLLNGLSASDLRQSDFMFIDEPSFVAGADTTGSWYIFPQAGELIV